MKETSLTPAIATALRHHQSGALEDAEAGYLDVLRADPDDVDALHLLSTLRLQQGNPEGALALAERVIALMPDAADAHSNKGSALQALERFGEAAAAFRAAIGHAPGGAHLHYNLGNALRAADDKAGAVRAYRRAVKLMPELAQAQSNLGATLSELGLFDDACGHCRAAIRHAPGFADAHYNLANAHREAGRFEDAVTSYIETIRLDPEHADAHCNLGLTEMRGRTLDDAVTTLGRAVHIDPGHDMARFYHAVAVEMTGADAEPLFRKLPADDPAVAAWIDSWTYIKSHSDLQTVIVHDAFRLLDIALAAARLDGMVLEFGVRHGVSIRHLALAQDGPVHGFDSFRGLPSAWGGEPAGVYSTEGALPDVPASVTLHEGLFEETLQPFLKSHAGDVRLCNIDCDIYTSTVSVLDGLAPRIRPGSVLVFDEYLVNPTWRDDEFRAFQEAVQRYGWRYRYLAFGIVTKQAAVMIEGT